MGLSNSERARTTYVKMYSKEPGTDNVNAFFGLSEKVDGDWKLTQRFDTVTGMLESISVGEYVYKDEPKKTLKVVLTDDSGERIQVESGFSMLAYNVINTLAGSDLSKEIKLRLYVNTKGETPRASVYIEIGGERASWKYSNDQLPKPITHTVGKKKVIDDTHVVEFYEDMVREVSEKLVIQKKATQAQPAQSQSPRQSQGEPSRSESAISKLAQEKRISDEIKSETKARKNETSQDEAPPMDESSWENGEDDDLPF